MIAQAWLASDAENIAKSLSEVPEKLTPDVFYNDTQPDITFIN